MAWAAVRTPTDTARTSGHIVWTVANLGEAMPGVCTPLSWTYFARPVEAGMRGGCYRLGALSKSEILPGGVDDSFVAPFHGRTAMNLTMMGTIANRMPGTSASDVELQLFGAVRHTVDDRPVRAR